MPLVLAGMNVSAINVHVCPCYIPGINAMKTVDGSM